MEISLRSYAVRSKRYLASQSMRQKIWRIFFHTAFWRHRKRQT